MVETTVLRTVNLPSAARVAALGAVNSVSLTGETSLWAQSCDTVHPQRIQDQVRGTEYGVDSGNSSPFVENDHHHC